MTTEHPELAGPRQWRTREFREGSCLLGKSLIAQRAGRVLAQEG